MIGERIRMLRERCGMSREQLAESIGVSVAAIEHYEANRWRPGQGLITRMASLLKATVPELVGDCLAVQDEDGSTVYIKNFGCGRFCTVGRTK
ncbi:helix-turn-helix transcriptional regulator [Sporomusa sp.]|jgi:transcriptional regulator with XRE-family HTH domain|uniref:helix-turn-helix transcriptional regulator n=1 Tax=Sporomusa sp. TaxID=2078658 RepID=UPI002BAB6CE6|nr:helix-turn-helix transcriptional regulator [Sporomusa sp.]HWR10146.1 helix-turn-helix transcriptional regulator [Sporomusa sp.]